MIAHARRSCQAISEWEITWPAVVFRHCWVIVGSQLNYGFPPGSSIASWVWEGHTIVIWGSSGIIVSAALQRSAYLVTVAQ